MIKKLIDFKKNENQLEILKRQPLPINKSFFQAIYKSIFEVTGFVRKSKSKQDIKNLLVNSLPKNIQCNPFYDIWLDDMSKVCKLFCEFLNENKLSFWLGNSRGCSRFHVDMVPYRLLVTYEGQGTELLPDHAADRVAFTDGKSNSKIIKDKSSLKSLDKWDIAIFKGGKNGILHRTPDSALKDYSSILMRLDNFSFLEDIRKINGVA